MSCRCWPRSWWGITFVPLLKFCQGSLCAYMKVVDAWHRFAHDYTNSHTGDSYLGLHTCHNSGNESSSAIDSDPHCISQLSSNLCSDFPSATRTSHSSSHATNLHRRYNARSEMSTRAMFTAWGIYSWLNSVHRIRAFNSLACWIALLKA